MLSRDRLDQSLVQNQILACMPVEAFAMLAPQLTRVGLNRRAILQERNRRLEDVHFIEAGVASILAWTPQDGPVQVGLVGRFGLVGVSAVLGVAGSPHRCLMQTDGEALRVSGDELAKIVDAFPSFRHQILNYVHFLLIQNSQFALCNARHELEARVSRLLLLTLDRLDGDIIPVTHDQLSMMLGVRRAGITETLATLESAGAVRRCRGAVEITDRTILEARACECYRIIAAERLRRERVPREFCSDAELVL
jgi:CRP-like cAMP-binding protein